jgi:Fe-S oxidoreductase
MQLRIGAAAGERYLYQVATAENIENLSKYSFKRIVTTCPHCFNTIKNDNFNSTASLT